MERPHSYIFDFRVLLAFIILPGSLLLSPARADIINDSGTTAGGPVWNRPMDNGTDPPFVLSSVGDTVPYNQFSFQVTIPGLYTFLSTATDPEFWDNYTFLYVNSFDPTNPLTNVVIGNDDNPSTGFSGFDASLASGTNYVFVTTGFSDFDEGAFQNSITLTQAAPDPPTDPATAPEPNTMLLFGTGLALAGAARRLGFRLP